MKHCPTCNRSFPDDVAPFCNDDGARLISDRHKPMSHWSRVGWSIVGVSLSVFAACVLTWNFFFILMGGSLSLAGVITGVVIVVAKRYESRIIDDLHAGKGVLVHWSYTPEEWNAFVAREVKQNKNLMPWIPSVHRGASLFDRLLGDSRKSNRPVRVFSAGIANAACLDWGSFPDTQPQKNEARRCHHFAGRRFDG